MTMNSIKAKDSMLKLFFLMLVLAVFIVSLSCRNNDTKKERLRSEDGSCHVQDIVDSNGDCGYLDLPTDYSTENGATQAVFWYKAAALNKDKKRGTIVLLAGGPGVSLANIFLDFVNSPKWETLHQYYDIMSFDYRGVGLSDPFLTEALFYCDYMSIQQGEEQIRSAIKKCMNLLEENNIVISSMNTAYIVQDLKRILDHLKIDTAVLYGMSYGSRVALTAMRDIPDRIKGVILDGVYPIEVNGLSDGGRGLQYNIRHFLGTYHEEKHLLPTEYGDIEQRILAITQLSASADLAFYIENILLLIAVNAYDEFRYLIADLLLNAFENRDRDLLDRLLMYFEFFTYNYNLDYKFPYSREDLLQLDLRPISMLQTAAVVLAEEYAYLKEEQRDRNLFNLPESVFHYVREYIGGEPIPKGILDIFQDLLQIPPAPIIETKAVKSEIPALIFSGSRDTKTPSYWGAMVAENLKNSYHIINRYGEHVYTRTSTCTLDIIDEFAEDPARIHNLNRVTCMDKAIKDMSPIFEKERLVRILNEIADHLGTEKIK